MSLSRLAHSAPSWMRSVAVGATRSGLVSSSASTGCREYHGFDILSRQSIEASQAINKKFELDAPFQKTVHNVLEVAEPIVMAIAEEQKAEKKMQGKNIELYVPSVPHVLPVARWCRDNDIVRKVLVHDDEIGTTKPRLSWYHPDDRMVPRGWFKEGLVGDWNYYFGYLGLEVEFGTTPTASTPRLSQASPIDTQSTAQCSQQNFQQEPVQSSDSQQNFQKTPVQNIEFAINFDAIPTPKPEYFEFRIERSEQPRKSLRI